MKVFLKILLWVGLVAAVLLVVILLAAQIPKEFRDVGKGGVYDLFRYLIATYKGEPFVPHPSVVPPELFIRFLPLF